MATQTKSKKFTFKTIKPVGKWRAFDTNQYLIKLDGEEVGQIYEREINGETFFQPSFTVMKTDELTDNFTKCPWMWIKLALKRPTLQEIHDILNSEKFFNSIIEKYTLYKSE